MTESRYKLEFSSGYLFHSMEIGIIVAKKNSCAILIQMRTDYLFFFLLLLDINKLAHLLLLSRSDLPSFNKSTISYVKISPNFLKPNWSVY